MLSSTIQNLLDRAAVPVRGREFIEPVDLSVGSDEAMGVRGTLLVHYLWKTSEVPLHEAARASVHYRLSVGDLARLFGVQADGEAAGG